MEYKYLGKTGIRLSALGMGTMTFGREADEKTSRTLYKRCREVGINLFDSANIYNDGKAEVILGKLIQGERDKIVLTSKVGFPEGKDVNAKGLSRRHIFQSIERSLKRLQTDYVDIYFMHRFDEHTALEESLRALEDIVHQGKSRYIGVSNFSAWQTMKALGMFPIVCAQPMYNLVKRQAEVEIFPLALSENLGIIPYNPLGGGLLTGKYASSKVSSQSRFKFDAKYKLRYGNPQAKEIATRFALFAKKRHFHPAALAIAWTASHPAVTSPLLGARSLQQLNECLLALEIEMTPDLRKQISALSYEPPLATDRSEEQGENFEKFYPVK